VFGWFLAAQSAKLHGWKWIIWAAENRVGGVKKKIIEFYLQKRIKDISEEELTEAKKWFKEHFTLIKNNKLYTYKDMLAIGRKLNSQEQRQAFMIDPYNGLYKETDNEHLYDYHAMQEMLLFRDETKCGIYLNVHAITEALRRRYPKGHDLEGQPMPPHKADTEGGGKFSNKADDFIIVHRMPQHKERWMEMEVHIQKIKEAESGGKQTVLNEPVMLKMMRGSVGYEEMNPVTQMAHQQLVDYTEPQKELSDDFDCPFNWDAELEKVIGDKTDYAIRIQDDYVKADNPIMTLPIISKTVLDRLGYIYYPEYKGMWADNDLFEVCQHLGVIQHTPLTFEHKHYINKKAKFDETYARHNNTANYAFGKKLLEERRKNNFGC
jgi:hypothetical protein